MKNSVVAFIWRKKVWLQLGLLLVPMVSFAQTAAPSPVTSLDGVRDLVLCRIADWMFTFAIVISIILSLYAAFKYLTSGGSEEEVDKATKAITYVGVGIAVAILAKGVPAIVGSLFYSDDAAGSLSDICR